MNKSSAVKAKLLNEIKAGAFAKGRALPGEIELARRYGVSRGTVRIAFAELQREGLVVRGRGSGTFLSERGERHSGVIGLFMPQLDSCEFFKEASDQFVRYAERMRYSVAVCKLESSSLAKAAGEMRAIAHEMVSRPVEGVVFRPLIGEGCEKINLEVVRIFEHAHMPVVLVDSDVVDKPRRSSCDLVAVNNVDAGRKVAEYLIGQGRRRIGFLRRDCVSGSNVNLEDRLFGVAGESVVRGLCDGVRSLGFDPADTAALMRLYRSKWRPDAIVCAMDEVAVALVKALTAIGRKVPEDVAVVGFDDVACARAAVPPLTTVSQPCKAIAQNLFRALQLRIRNPAAEPREIYLDARLVARGTA